jgi:hypothetical protein
MLIDELFRGKSERPLDVQFESAKNASELSIMLCRLMATGYDILHDGPVVFKCMERLGVKVKCEELTNPRQLVAESDDPEDMRNQKFIVVMGDGAKHLITFDLGHNYNQGCHQTMNTVVQV